MGVKWLRRMKKEYIFKYVSSLKVKYRLRSLVAGVLFVLVVPRVCVWPVVVVVGRGAGEWRGKRVMEERKEEEKCWGE